MRHYALWELRTSNMVGSFDTEHDALSLVREAMELNGPDITDDLALNIEDDAGHIEPVAEGHALAELARRELAEPHIIG